MLKQRPCLKSFLRNRARARARTRARFFSGTHTGTGFSKRSPDQSEAASPPPQWQDDNPATCPWKGLEVKAFLSIHVSEQSSCGSSFRPPSEEPSSSSPGRGCQAAAEALQSSAATPL